MNSRTKKIAGYLLMPQVLPRINMLFGSGFHYLAFNLALICQTIRLLPNNHPYLYPPNIGRFGVSHVIIAAAHNIKLSWKTLDQVFIFMVLMLGMALLLFQFIMLVAALFISGASAAPPLPTNFAEFFSIEPAINPVYGGIVPGGPLDDMAFVLLERVFGVPGPGGLGGFFNSCVSQGVGCFQSIQAMGYAYDNDFLPNPPDGPFPWPFHDALRSMMELYSTGILVVGMLIFAYFVIVVIAETAQEGTPFGKRFNHVWAPLRIVLALGLIVPVANGLNSAQYITLNMAKWGSNFASNGWLRFHQEVTGAAAGGGTFATILGNSASLTAWPQKNDTSAYMEFFAALAACNYIHHKTKDPASPDYIQMYMVRDNNMALGPYLTGQTAAVIDLPSGLDLWDALQFSEYDDVHLVWGIENAILYGDEKGRVKPICGEMIFRVPTVINAGAGFGAGTVGGGPYTIEDGYFTTIQVDWSEAETAPKPGGPGGINCPAVGPILAGAGSISHCGIGKVMFDCYYGNAGVADCPAGTIMPTQDHLEFYRNGIVGPDFDNAVTAGMAIAAQDPRWGEFLISLGWGGAAIWFNRVAQLNGEIMTAAANFPVPYHYPAVMEEVKKNRQSNDAIVEFRDRFRPYNSDEAAIETKATDDEAKAHTMYQAQKVWFGQYPDPSKNVFIDMIKAIFGLEGLFNMQKNQVAGIHPIAQLALIGKGLIESGMRSFAAAGGAFVGGGIANILGQYGAGDILDMISEMAKTVAFAGLTIGFVLFYIVPIMPFIYFFFALGGWIKGIFEAMVGLPLWGLAHIRIDGNGLPGDAAMNGYYLILEIFLRPILILFGLIASMIIFQAQVTVLNDIWPLIVQNLTGFDSQASAFSPETGIIQYMRGTVDTLFYTVIYALVVYMLGTSAFKMVDMVPNHILRWLGASVPTFGEQAGDPAENLVRNTMYGGQMATSQLSRGASQLGAGLKGMVPRASGPPPGQQA